MKIVAFSPRSAFTLVEIMIVVAIIGLLSVISIPHFITYREIATKDKCLANMRQIEGGLTIAALETDASTDNLSEDGIRAVVAPDYIRRMPHCSLGTYSTDGLGNVHCSTHLPGSADDEGDTPPPPRGSPFQ